MNLVVLMGRLARDPELKFGQSGKAYSRFSLAVDNPFKKGEADFINCVAFGKTAEVIGEYLRKGSKVLVNGRLQMNKYEVNGEKRTSYDVLVNEFEFAEGKSGGAQSFDNQQPSYNNQQSSSSESQNFSPKVANNAPAQDDFSDDEFPF